MGQQCCANSNTKTKLINDSRVPIRLTKEELEDINLMLQKNTEKNEIKNDELIPLYSNKQKYGKTTEINNNILPKSLEFRPNPDLFNKNTDTIKRVIKSIKYHQLISFNHGSETERLIDETFERINNNIFLDLNLKNLITDEEILNYIYNCSEFKYLCSVTKVHPNRVIKKIISEISNHSAASTNLLAASKKNLNTSQQKLRYNIYQLLNNDQIYSLNPQEIIIKGELYRYHPGFATHFINKYCILTKTTFNYYKNEFYANYNREKPIFTIPTQNILAVKRANNAIPEYKKFIEKYKLAKDFNAQFKFEIFLKENPEKYTKINPGEISEDKIKLRNSELKEQNAEIRSNIKNNDNHISNDLSNIPVTTPRDKIYSNSMIEVDKNFISSKNDNNKSNFNIDIYNQNFHLMRSPFGNKSRDSLEFIEKLAKNVSQADENEKEEELHTWTKREIRWYLSESRLLFLAENEEELEKWMCTLKWIIKINQGKFY